MIHQQRFNSFSQLGFLIALIGAGIIVSSIVAGIIGSFVMHIPLQNLAEALLKPENIQMARLVQVLTTFFIMAIPAFVVAGLNGKNAIASLGFNELANSRQVLWVVFIVVAGFLLSGSLGELNKMIPLPENTEAYFRKLEDNYNKEVMSIGSMRSTADYVLSVFVLALVPAIFEEMLFRGCLQQICISLTRNSFGGILITSIIFSAIHLSYYGFLPRLFLGLMLGYIFYFSKNIWLSIIAHFLNNAYTLTAMFVLSRSGKLTTEAMEETFPLYYGLIGFVVICFLFVALKRESTRVLDNAIEIHETNNSLL